MKRALVLGGGGSFGIAWESGLLVGLCQGGVDVRQVDRIVGTSAGSQVAAVLASGISWDQIWNRQVSGDPQGSYVPAKVHMPSLFRLYSEIELNSNTPAEWIIGLGTLSRFTVTVSPEERIEEIQRRIQTVEWLENTSIVAVDVNTGNRVVWTKETIASLSDAVASSSALPGVYPAVTIDGRKYCDGGIHSMENADIAEGHDKVLILSTGLPIRTPYTLNQQIESLEKSRSKVLVLQPSPEVMLAFSNAGGNALDPATRGPVARAAKFQGERMSDLVSKFWLS